MISQTAPSRPHPRHRLLATTLAVGLVAVAACGGDDDGGSDRSGLAGYVATLPAAVVAGGDAVEISVGDLDRAAAAAGLERPDRDDHEGVSRFVAALSGLPLPGSDERAPTFVPFPTMIHQTAGRLEEFEDELGWTVADVSWFAERSTPPTPLTVLGGDFDPERLGTAMGDDVDGRWALGPADGHINIDDRTIVRPLGESLRLALDDDRLFVGRTSEFVDAAIAVDDDDGDRSLAEHPIVGPLVEAVDGEDVYAATFFLGHGFVVVPPLADGSLDAERLEEIFEQALPAPFDGLAVGAGMDADGEPYVVIAYAHVNESMAESNAEAIPALVAEGASIQTGEPWADRFTGVDVSVTDDHVVVARLSLTDDVPVSIGYHLVVRRDGLVSHR